MNGLMECSFCNNTESDCIILRIPSPYRGVDLICERCAKPEPKKIPLREDYERDQKERNNDN
jgi:hypothetical protein